MFSWYGLIRKMSGWGSVWFLKKSIFPLYSHYQDWIILMSIDEKKLFFKESSWGKTYGCHRNFLGCTSSLQEESFQASPEALLVKWTIWGWNGRAISVLDESLQSSKSKKKHISSMEPPCSPVKQFWIGKNLTRIWKVVKRAPPLKLRAAACISHQLLNLSESWFPCWESSRMIFTSQKLF